FLWQRDILDGLKMPWVALIGNHDCLGSGEQAFEAVFGKLNFHFTAGNVLFVCLNTNALEYDYNTPVPDFSYISELLANLPEYVTKTVFVMHARPYADGFNNNVAEVFDYASRRFPNVQFYLFGHEHKRMEKDLFNTGLIYYGVPNIEKRQYYLFTIKEKGYECEIVDF
ncbi:MAG: metallophosphoesterase, partial [Bacteroidaceae bacterium]|nr:metallophosphoesterase [Bacteroidaceae bacterium]